MMMKSNRCEIGYKLMKPFVLANFKRKYKPTVIGKENIPSSGPIIFCGNHRHKDDQYNVMLVTDRVIHMLSKDEYFKGNKAWFYRAACCIPVDRSIHDESAKNEAISILKDGGAIGLFPEGTRDEITCKKEEIKKVSKILGISEDEVFDKFKNQSIRTTQVNLLIELNENHKITNSELKKYILDADDALKKLLKKRVITKKEYIDSLLLPFKYGAVSFAKKTGALIVPYGISGNYSGKEGKLTTRVGKPIDVSSMSMEDANSLLRKKIIELID